MTKTMRKKTVLNKEVDKTYQKIKQEILSTDTALEFLLRLEKQIIAKTNGTKRF